MVCSQILEMKLRGKLSQTQEHFIMDEFVREIYMPFNILRVSFWETLLPILGIARKPRES